MATFHLAFASDPPWSWLAMGCAFRGARPRGGGKAHPPATRPTRRELPGYPRLIVPHPRGSSEGARGVVHQRDPERLSRASRTRDPLGGVVAHRPHDGPIGRAHAPASASGVLRRPRGARRISDQPSSALGVVPGLDRASCRRRHHRTPVCRSGGCGFESRPPRFVSPCPAGVYRFCSRRCRARNRPVRLKCVLTDR